MTTPPTPDLWAEPTTEQADANLRAAGPLGEAFAATMREQLARPCLCGKHYSDPVHGAPQPEGHAYEAVPEQGAVGDPGDGPELPNLPAPIGDNTGQLDLATLSAALPLVRADLVLALRQAAADHRRARGTVVTAEDTYPLVRRLTEADEVLGQWSRAFADAAKEARAIIEEEALTVAGAEHEGTLSDSLYVPDGVGRRIAVRGDWQAGSSTWDVPSLIGWLVDDEVAEAKGADALQRKAREQGVVMPKSWDDDEVREVARNIVDRLLALGSYTPNATKIKTLRVKLAELGRDAEAAVIAQVRSVGLRTYKGVKVTREDSPS